MWLFFKHTLGGLVGGGIGCTVGFILGCMVADCFDKGVHSTATKRQSSSASGLQSVLGILGGLGIAAIGTVVGAAGGGVSGAALLSWLL